MVASMLRVRRVISALRRSQPIAASRARFEAVISRISAIKASVAASAPALTHIARHDEAPPSPAPFSIVPSAICGIYGTGTGLGKHERGRPPLAEARFAALSPGLRPSWSFQRKLESRCSLVRAPEGEVRFQLALE
jgi:hypothetical protein